MTNIITHFADISADYGTAFVDLWGCVHNGVQAFGAAVAALRAYRTAGGVVILVTNSPQPKAGVMRQLTRFGVPDDCWDDIATSGDSARAAMFQGAVGQKVWFMGEERRDSIFFEPMQLLDNPLTITRVPLEQAEGIVCCGPFDPMAHPDENRPAFLEAKTRGMKLLCANPDIIVDRGETREWCAGALAQLYTEMGGTSLYFGKPHPPIYDLARRRLAKLARRPLNDAIIAIGDGLGTDIAGAMGEDIDSLFITGGLAAAETKTKDQPDPAALAQVLQAATSNPTYSIGYLR